MKRRLFLASALGVGGSLPSGPSWAQDRWGASKGYPTGWGPAGERQRWEGHTEYHVGNFSGGVETMLAHQRIQASASPFVLKEAKRSVKFNMFSDASQHAARHNLSGLLIARNDEIWHEEYRFQRTADMRFFGWSMTKSLLGLMVGVALDQGKLQSLDDRLDQHLPALANHPFADITLRHLLNMTSGIDICEAFCAPNNGFDRFGHSQIGFHPNRGQGTDQIKTLLEFKWGRNEPQGRKFNYTDVNPTLVAWVLESVYQQPLARIAQELIWQPMGAAADATWLTDSKGFTLSGAGVSATLRDWARLGLLVAHEGHLQGRQIVSRAWIDETSRHTEKDQAARFNLARPNRGYRNFLWHHSADGRMLRMAGAMSQNVMIDKKTRTVLVQTCVGPENGVDEMMSSLFAAACAM